eukprot:14105198-Alexandrium_andersonii.AAC.1
MGGSGEGLCILKQAPFSAIGGPPSAALGLLQEPGVRLPFMPSKPHRIVSHGRDASILASKACSARTGALLQP